MKIVVLLLGFFSLSVSLLKAGDVYLITGAPEVHGKATLNGSSVHVEGGSAPDIKLSDVLEADFADGDFHLDYFSSNGAAINQLPQNWQGRDIGRVDVPGANTYAKGVLTISGNGRGINSAKDRLYYLGQPWTGNGEWTIHVKEITTAEVGLMLRENPDPSAAMFGFGTVPVRVDGGTNGLQHHRNNAGEGSQWNAFSVDEPFWLRLSRNSANFDIALSSDGRKWGVVEQDVMPKFPPSFLAGIFITSNAEDVVGKAVVDQILFTPPQAEPETLPAGVLLRDGSFLAGSFGQLDPKTGAFSRTGKNVSISPDQVASALFDSVTMHQLAEVDSQTGIIMKNGDFTASTLVSVGYGVQMNSILLGPLTYYFDSVRACVLQPVKPLPSDYEIRLKDGSSIRASGISVDNGQLAIHDISGITVTADFDEVAQFRAGPALVQTLIDLPWKATPASVPVPGVEAAPAAKTAPAPNSVPATNAVATANPPVTAPASTDSAPATNAATVANVPAAVPTAPMDEPSVRCWQGNNQEQIMAVMPGTSIDFPLTGKFRALALKVALLPDAPPGAQASVRILADGKEIGRTPVKAGDQPRFVQVTLQDPKTITLAADSAVAGIKVLLIDPVAIRKNATPPPAASSAAYLDRHAPLPVTPSS